MVGVVQVGGGAGEIGHLGRVEDKSLFVEVLPRGGEALGGDGALDHPVLKGVVLHPGFQGVLHKSLLVHPVGVQVDDPLLGEEEGDTARLAQVAAELVKIVADVGRGAVAVVRQGLHQKGGAAGAVSLVKDLFIGVLALAHGLFDDPLDVVVGHVVGLGIGDGVAQLGVGGGVRPALFDGDRDLPAALGEDLGLRAVGLLLLALDVVPLGMSRHGVSSFFLFWFAGRGGVTGALPLFHF